MNFKANNNECYYIILLNTEIVTFCKLVHHLL